MSIVVSGPNVSKVLSAGESVCDVEVVGKKAALYVSGGAYVSGAVVRTSAYFYISDSGVISSLVLSAGTGRISGGGVLNDAALSARSFLIVSSGGTATGLSVASNANVNVEVYAADAATRISGSNDHGTFSLADGVASNFIIYSRGAQMIHSGAVTSDITVGNKASLTVASGGSALGVTQEDGALVFASVSGGDTATLIRGRNAQGEFYLSNGSAHNFMIPNGGILNVYSGGVAAETTVSGLMAQLNVYSGGTALGATVGANASLTLHEKTSATDIDVLSGGCLEVHCGAHLADVSVEGSAAFVSAMTGEDEVVNQEASEITRLSIGKTGVVSIAKNVVLKESISIAGVLTIADGVEVSADPGFSVELDVSGASAGAAPLISDLSWVPGQVDYTLRVAEWQKIGDFSLATGAATFDGTVTVRSESDDIIGQLAVDGEFEYGIYKYALGRNDDVLTLTVTAPGAEPPALPALAADVTGPTNRNVTVTANFGADAVTRQYSLDGVEWRAYVSGVEMADNGTVYFRALNILDIPSEVAEYTVSNIDRTAPEAPSARANTAKPTNKSVTVTATFSDDSAQKQYSTDNKTWKAYTTGVSVGGNGTVYFRGIDEAGNVSKVTSYKVTNIDKTAPAAPTAKANTTAVTNQSVTVTASFSKDTKTKQYSTDKKTWQSYSKAITVNANATLYFRGIDEAGNVSKVTSYKVANIDKFAPSVKASTTAPTNKEVKLTATYSKDAVKKQYSTNNKSWSNYSKAITVKSNATYYFRAVDKNGKASGVVTFKVSNIDKVAPKAPTVKANTTKLTNKNVTLTASFSGDSASKQYSTDKKSWKTYSKALSVDKNATYYFRGIDAAGNVSKVVSIQVKNIDKVAPKAPTVKLNSTKATNKSVTITANFSGDTKTKQYSTDNKTWKSCSGKLTVSGNGTYYFRGIDAAGNVSKVASIKVANIDKTAPAAPTVKLSSADAAKKTVTIAATFSKDTKTRQFSTDKKSWKSYSKSITVSKNATYYFRGIDEAGNISTVTSTKVSTLMNPANNSWEGATKLTGTTNGALDAKLDTVDYYNVGDVAKLMLDMEAGKAKVTFCSGSKQAVAVKVRCANGSEKTLSSLTLASGDKVNDNITLSDLGDAVKYLKIENAATDAAYKLAKLA